MPDEKDKDQGARGGPPLASHAAGTRPAQPQAQSQPQRAANPNVRGPAGRSVSAEPPPATQVDPAVVAAATAGAIEALQRQQAAAVGTPNMDKTVPGGVYIVDDKVVDCNGVERELPAEDGGEEAPNP